MVTARGAVLFSGSALKEELMDGTVESVPRPEPEEGLESSVPDVHRVPLAQLLADESSRDAVDRVLGVECGALLTVASFNASI